MSRRSFHVGRVLHHENPLVRLVIRLISIPLTHIQGLPKRPGQPPQLPRRGGPVPKRPIPNVTKVVAVASGKGGVGKSTVAGE